YPYYFAGPPIPFAELDADSDGKVSFAEFTAYYRKVGAGPISLVPTVSLPQGTDVVSDTLFKALDRDGDGKLSKAELEAAAVALRKFDQDDDEMITAAELGGGFGGFAQRPLPTGPGAPALPGLRFGLVPREDQPNRIAQRLQLARDIITRYDKDRNGK